MTAEKNGYATAWTPIRIESADQYIREDITMRPLDNSACITDADCDDGLFCNGIETCSGDGACQPGTGPCEEDGLFCNGEESCDEENGTCEHSGSPCPGHLECVEDSDQCVDKECSSDADCDDQEFCNGLETCLEGTCRGGTNPCSDPTPECDEVRDVCLEGPHIQLLPNPCLQLRWMPMVLFLRIEGTDTHFNGSSLVTFDPPGAVMDLPRFWETMNISW